MRNGRWRYLLAASLSAGALSALAADEKPAEKTEKTEKTEKKDAKAKKAPKSVHAFVVKDIDGKAVALKKYRDQVLLLVNVASK